MPKKIKIIFTYFKNNYQEIKDEEENIINIFRNYALLIKEKFEDLIFLYQGKKLVVNNALKLKNFKKRIIKFLVINMRLKIETINEPKQIICPKCKNLSLFILNEDKISFNNCIKRDNISLLEIPKFIKSQIIQEEKIICDECFNSKSFYKMKFYKCFCNKNICPLCIGKHSKYKHNNKGNHIEYYETFYKCHIHNNLYISYCKECHKNLCSECEENCKNHTIINFKKIKPGEKKINLIKKEINEGKEKINHYMKNLEKLKIILDKKIKYLIEYLNYYYKLIEKINYCFESLFNYENIQSLAYFESSKLLKYINYNLKEKIKKNLRIQIDLFDISNRMEMVYENKEQNSRTLLFGEEFFKKNKKNCILLINDEIKDFNNYYIFDSKKENSIKVELFEESKITNMSSLFNNCNSLTSVDISDWNMEKIISVSQMFKSCQFLSTIKSSSKWRLDNIKNDISYIFFECSKLKEIPDISNWNTKNIINMSYIFKGCSELKSLPDISKWDTRNVVNMSNIFSGCKSLFSLPDISKWDISKVTDLSGIFSECKELKNFPDISNWNTREVINMKYMFNQCTSLLYLPDISKWKTKKVESFYQMFNDCLKLKEIPKIEETWIISNKCDVTFMFQGCVNLKPSYIEYNKKFIQKKKGKIQLWDQDI